MRQRDGSSIDTSNADLLGERAPAWIVEMADPSFQRFMNQLVLPLDESEVRLGLAQYFRERGVESSVAEMRATKVAKDFHSFQRALADEDFTFEGVDETRAKVLHEAARRFATACKRAWLRQRLESEFADLGL